MTILNALNDFALTVEFSETADVGYDDGFYLAIIFFPFVNNVNESFSPALVELLLIKLFRLLEQL